MQNKFAYFSTGLSFLGGLFTIVGLLFSHFLISLGTILLALSLAFQKNSGNRPILLFFLLLFFISLIFSVLQNQWLVDYTMLKFSYVLFGIIAYRSSTFQPSIVRFIFLVFIFLISVINILSVANYILNFQSINESLLKSKSIPILADVEHIYFGLLSCFCSLSLLYFLFFKGKSSNILSRQWLIVLFGLNFLCIHILSSRTGLLVLYTGLASLLIIQSIKNSSKKFFVISMAGIIVLPVLSFFIFPSFKNKVYNSMEDYHALIRRENVNHKSMAQRVESWRATYWCILEKPWVGWSKKEEGKTLAFGYQATNSQLINSNRLDVHNQFLAEAFFRGIFGLILFLFFIGYWLHYLKNSPLSVSYTIGLLLAMILEPLLERQLGFVVFFFLPILALKLEQKKNRNIDLSQR